MTRLITLLILTMISFSALAQGNNGGLVKNVERINSNTEMHIIEFNIDNLNLNNNTQIPLQSATIKIGGFQDPANNQLTIPKKGIYRYFISASRSKCKAGANNDDDLTLELVDRNTSLSRLMIFSRGLDHCRVSGSKMSFLKLNKDDKLVLNAIFSRGSARLHDLTVSFEYLGETD